MTSSTLELISLKRFSHSVGTVESGERFSASTLYAGELVDAGFARFASGPARISPRRAGAWAGCSMVIVASGPSLTEEDLTTVRAWRDALPEQRKVMVVGLTFLRALWADALYAADTIWWDRYHAQVRESFSGERWSQSEEARKNYGTRFILAERRDGLSRIPGVIHQGGNSGYQAIGLAYERGAEKIILLAFDMQRTFGRLHHHDPYPKGFPRECPFERWIPRFAALARDLDREGVKVINASRATALGCFDRAALAEALEDDAPRKVHVPKRAWCRIRPQLHYRRSAFLEGLSAIGCTLLEESSRSRSFSPDDLLVIWNRYGDDHLIACQVEAAGGTVIVAENGYLSSGGGIPKFDKAGPPESRYYALALSGHNGSGVSTRGSAARWAKLGVTMQEFHSLDNDGHILVCPNRSFGRPDMVMPFDWAEYTVASIKRYTSRQVRVRPHPLNSKPKTPLSDDLRGAWAAVIWSSSAGVHALVEGVPVFQCGPYFVCSAATGKDLKSIEQPLIGYEHREEAMVALSGAQWSLTEIASGEAFMRLLELRT